ncbi:GNAT family N-acetyltransferase [Homoserinibacter sp. YIM 151385]|uniref:GNAT family N-acetyltransferase n=1 Tax=Homoserinibacter sp. YIM 151385 TaxID=2985506 RepID=UPI0022F0B3B5|nr:GNAT family protein [Homoserinibacter sp. YIM 151385]WBU37186.1 GNAT family protein [Homoserinibacter sp. YIM 151385]
MTARLDLSAPIETARLRLRTLTEVDVSAVHGWRRDPAVTRYLPYGPQTREQVRSSLAHQSRTTRLAIDGARAVLAAERLDGGGVVGELHLVLTSAANHGYEVGWVFSPDVAGQGFATEAALAILELAFRPDAGAAHRVVAQLDPRNTASTRLCARLGMREEAHFRKDWPVGAGGWSDTGIWAILDEEWASRTA